MKDKKLSIVIVCVDRVEISNMFEHNQHFFANTDIEILIVTTISFADNISFLLSNYPEINLKIYALDVNEFNKSLFLNAGISNSIYDNILVLDCDIIVPRDFFKLVMKTLDDDFIFNVRCVRESKKTPFNDIENGILKKVSFKVLFEFKSKTKKQIGLITNSISPGSSLREGPGIVAFNKEDFNKVDGYNSELKFWGWEDLDFMLRLIYITGKSIKKSGVVVHLSHNDSDRNVNVDGKQSSNDKNFFTSLINYNYENFRGSLSSDLVLIKNTKLLTRG